MKKLFVSFLCIFTCLTLTGCSLLFDYKDDAIDNFDIGYSEELNKAFASLYNWDGRDETKNIVIPEEYNGAKITELGGYYGSGVPCSFGIGLSEQFKNTICNDANYWFVSKKYEDIGSVDTIYLNFNLHISKNIEKITKHKIA